MSDRTKNKPYNCDLHECILTWQETTQTQEQEDADYLAGNLGLQHCENSNCHNIYWRNKSGNKCKKCGAQRCEVCSEYPHECTVSTKNSDKSE